MFVGWVLGAKRQEQLNHAWLRGPICEFMRERLDEGYKPSTLRLYLNWFLRFSEFAERRGVQDWERLPELIEPLVTSTVPSERQRRKWRSALNWFVFPGRRGITLPPDAYQSPEHPHGSLVDDYTDFLRANCGQCEEVLRRIRRHCLRLMAFVDEQGLADPADMRPAMIREFLRHEGVRCSRLTLRSHCSAIRGFLSFLYRQGLVHNDWSSAVVSPCVYKDESCPRFMTRSEVDATLAVIDRQTRQGRRDYSMLLLMAVYGVRGIEVCRLELCDIDWRHDKLQIRNRKAGNNTAYPLAPSVGNAIIAYLRDGRPTTDSSHVFLSVDPPFAPITATATLSHLVRKYSKRAGITVERPGTHTFRYSCAQRLLEQRLPLKHIGDYLGHAHPDSTRRYMKIGIDQLREVAMGDAEDLLR